MMQSPTLLRYNERHLRGRAIANLRVIIRIIRAQTFSLGNVEEAIVSRYKNQLSVWRLG